MTRSEGYKTCARVSSDDDKSHGVPLPEGRSSTNSLFLGKCSRFGWSVTVSAETVRLKLLDLFSFSPSDLTSVDPLAELPLRTPMTVPNLSSTAIVARLPLSSPPVLLELKHETEVPLKVIASSLSVG